MVSAEAEDESGGSRIVAKTEESPNKAILVSREAALLLEQAGEGSLG